MAEEEGGGRGGIRIRRRLSRREKYDVGKGEEEEEEEKRR